MPNQFSPTKLTTSASLAAMAGIAIILHACSGPQPLDIAIRPTDELAYLGALSGDGVMPREVFLRAKSNATGKTFEQVEQEDLSLSTTKNPFNAKKDPEAVSRGAVIYKYNCMNCHGIDATGHGPEMPQSSEEMDFHRFSTRFAVTLHGGAPSKWFRIIDEGVTSEMGVDAEGKPLIMKPFHDNLAREQIWMVVTYLQSLDNNAEHRNH